MGTFHSRLFASKAALALASLFAAVSTGAAQTLYVANSYGSSGGTTNATVGMYNATTGATINSAFVSGLRSPSDVAVSNGVLYVVDQILNTVSTYNATTGATINGSFISGLGTPICLELGNNILYVSCANTTMSVGAYNAATGAVINRSLITGISNPGDMALAGNVLYVCSSSNNRVSTYNATTGALINQSFLTGLNAPIGLLISGNALYVANHGSTGTVEKYDLATGTRDTSFFPSVVPPNGPEELALLDNTLYVTSYNGNSVFKYNAITGAFIANGVSGLNSPIGIAVVGVPEPSAWAALLLCAGVCASLTRARGRVG